MSFFDNWKEFLIRAERQHLSTASQAAFYWIIAKFNAAHWAEEIELSDRELMRLTQIRSTKTITDVKSRLKLSGLIDFRTSKYYGTTYKLVQLASTSWNDTQNDAQGNTQENAHRKTRGSAPLIKSTHNISNQEDIRQEDTKTRVRDTGEGVSKGLSEEIKSLFIGFYGSMDWNDEYTLARYEKQYGVEKVKSAIETAIALKHGRDRLLLPYIGGILTNSKGGKNNGNGDSKPSSTDSEDDRFAYRKQYADL